MMTKHLRTVTLSLITILLSHLQATGSHEKEAEQFVQLLAAGKFEAVVAKLDPVMKQAMPVSQAEVVWNGLIGQTGPLLKCLDTRTEQCSVSS